MKKISCNKKSLLHTTILHSTISFFNANINSMDDIVLVVAK